jgi:hypothetical protein
MTLNLVILVMTIVSAVLCCFCRSDWTLRYWPAVVSDVDAQCCAQR